jgi:hypothetical protein
MCGPQIRDAHLRALRGAVIKAGTRISAAAIAAAVENVKDAMRAATRPGGACDDDGYRLALGCAAGALGGCSDADTLKGLLSAGPLGPLPAVAAQRQLNGIILAVLAEHAGR